MSFLYKHKKITLENYKEIFAVCSDDILDEIRSAILDDTPIEKYIGVCGDDNYLLGQIRMALRECLPEQFILPCVTANTMKHIRYAYKAFYGTNVLDSILRYTAISENGLPTLTISKSTFESIVDLICIGVDISSVDFTQVSEDAVPLFCSGLSRGLPMWLLIGVETNRLEVLMRGMQLGVDIHCFIADKSWTNSKLYTLFSYAKQIDLNTFLSYVTSKFDEDMLHLIIELAIKGKDYTCITLVDTQGYPLYSYSQMYALRPAIMRGIEKSIVPCYQFSAHQIEKQVEALITT